MKIKTTVYVYYAKYSWQQEGEFFVFYAKIDDTQYQTYVCTQEIELDVPDDYNPTAQQLASLQKEKEKAQEEFSEKVASINERISKLQAIEFTA